MVPEKLDEPLRGKKPRRIFVNSMSDLFHPEVPDEFIADTFAVMAVGNWHTYQVLTKRAGRMASLVGSEAFRVSVGEAIERLRPALEKIRGDWGLVSPVVNGIGKGMAGYWPLESVWLGVSVEDQRRADERIPHLLKCPAEVRFLSVEPQIGPIEFSDVTGRSDAVQQLGKKALDGIQLVIVGGESGPRARPFDLAWARSIVRQCRAAGVAAFVKQLSANPYDSADPGRQIKLKDSHGGNWDEWPEDLKVREFPRQAEVTP
jgi:protein gp37